MGNGILVAYLYRTTKSEFIKSIVFGFCIVFFIINANASIHIIEHMPTLKNRTCFTCPVTIILPWSQFRYLLWR